MIDRTVDWHRGEGPLFSANQPQTVKLFGILRTRLVLAREGASSPGRSIEVSKLVVRIESGPMGGGGGE